MYITVIWYTSSETLSEVTRFENLTVSSLPAAAQLKQSDWPNGFVFGTTVRCGAQVRLDADATLGPESSSGDFLAGIKIVESEDQSFYKYVYEGSSINITYQSTVPMPCVSDTTTPCSVRFQGEVVNQVARSCGGVTTNVFEIGRDNSNNTHELKVSTNRDGVYGSRWVQIRLVVVSSTGLTSNAWLADGLSVSINQRILIFDTDRYGGGNGGCTVTSDPHFFTFDQQRFDVHLPGEFVLYRHTSLPLEVRGFFEQCYRGSKAHCVCGVAVRSGTEVFVASNCRTTADGSRKPTPRVGVLRCAETPQMTISRRSRYYYSSFKIGLLNGRTVSYSPHRIVIRPSSDDQNLTLGLCGNYNDNSTDDIRLPDGTPFSDKCDDYLFPPSSYCILNEYGKKWRIPYNDSDSYYGTPNSLTSFCDVTPAPDFDCNNPPVQLGCNVQEQDLYNVYCPDAQTTGGSNRRKRATEANGGLTLPAIEVTPDPTGNFSVWPDGWNDTLAEAACLNTLTGSSSSSACDAVVTTEVNDTMLLNCKADIKLTGGQNFSIVALENYKDSCLTELEKNVTLANSTGAGGETIYELVAASACPQECSFQGTCTNGACVCEAEWIGYDCSALKSDTPSALELPDGALCDLGVKTCREVLVTGDTFVPSDDMKCRFEQQVVIEGYGMLPANNGPHIVDPVIIHSGLVKCTLPSGAGLETTEGAPVAYKISLSNFEDQFGTSILYLAYKSQDWTCGFTGEVPDCEKKGSVDGGGGGGGDSGGNAPRASLAVFISVLLVICLHLP